MLQWPLFNANITEFCQGVGKVNYIKERHADPILVFFQCALYKERIITLNGHKMRWTSGQTWFREGNLKFISNLTEGSSCVGGGLFT
jgi:hypothetical protein